MPVITAAPSGSTNLAAASKPVAAVKKGGEDKGRKRKKRGK